MGKRLKPVIAAFIANLFVVLLFFKPVTEGDTSIISIHPAIGLPVYTGLCISLLEWATRQVRNVYKGAFIVAAPQFVLVADLTLRGERGLLTAAAGTIVLAATWILIAYALLHRTPDASVDEKGWPIRYSLTDEECREAYGESKFVCPGRDHSRASLAVAREPRL